MGVAPAFLEDTFGDIEVSAADRPKSVQSTRRGLAPGRIHSILQGWKDVKGPFAGFAKMRAPCE
jgi:hypothetical protein